MLILRRLLLLLPITILCAASIAEEPSKPTKDPLQSLPKASPLAEQGPRPNPVSTPTAAEIDASLKRGIEFLLDHQNKNGSWGSESIFRPDEIYAPIPGSHHAF